MMSKSVHAHEFPICTVWDAHSYKCLLSCVDVIILRVWCTGTGGEEYGSTVSDLPSDSTRLFRSGEEANECIDHLLQQVATAGNRMRVIF